MRELRLDNVMRNVKTQATNYCGNRLHLLIRTEPGDMHANCIIVYDQKYCMAYTTARDIVKKGLLAY